MKCPLCDHPKSYRHGRTSKGSQRYLCPECKQSFTDTFDTLYYRRQVTPEQTRSLLQAHSEGSSLRGVSRTSGLAYGTVVSVIRAASVKGQMVHNQEVQGVETNQIGADEFWSFVKKAETVPTGRNPSWRLLGRVEFGANERVDFSGTSGQTHRPIVDGIIGQYGGQNQLPGVGYRRLGWI